MRRSTERILTTHVGSLPRPADLRKMWSKQTSGLAEAVGLPRKKWEIALINERGKDLPIKFPVAFERAVHTANLINREPAGVAHFCCVERQFTADVLRDPPVQSKSSPRRNVLPNLPNRPHRQADFFHRLSRHRRFLTLSRLDFPTDRRPMPSTSNVRRPLNKQNLFPFCDHGDDGVKHEFDRFVSVPDVFFSPWPKRGKRHHSSSS
jgi:hypothetical protein